MAEQLLTPTQVLDRFRIPGDVDLIYDAPELFTRLINDCTPHTAPIDQTIRYRNNYFHILMAYGKLNFGSVFNFIIEEMSIVDGYALQSLGTAFQAGDFILFTDGTIAGASARDLYVGAYVDIDNITGVLPISAGGLYSFDISQAVVGAHYRLNFNPEPPQGLRAPSFESVSMSQSVYQSGATGEAIVCRLETHISHIQTRT